MPLKEQHVNQPPRETRSVEKFTSDTAKDWMEWSGFALADVVNEDETPNAKLGGVGFTRSPKGSSSSFDFAYDEALIVTKGRCTIRSLDSVLTAGVGEVLYLPARVPGTIHADEELELVYVASSPYGEVNREIKAELLSAVSVAVTDDHSLSGPEQLKDIPVGQVA
jgi:quercetin dioxygenase-like cupin family protein